MHTHDDREENRNKLIHSQRGMDLYDPRNLQTLNSLYDQSYGEPPVAQDSAFNPREIINKIIARWWLILAIVTLATSVSAVNIYRQRSTYQATATIEVASDSALAAADKIIILDNSAETDLQTAMFLLQSSPLLLDVVTRLQLDKNPGFTSASGTRSIWEALRNGDSQGDAASTLTPDQKLNREPQLPGKMTAANASRPDPSLLGYAANIKANLKLSPVAGTRLISISYADYDPELATQIVNGIAECYIDRTFNKKIEQFSNTSQWLDATTRKFETQVKEAEQQLADYTRSRGIFNADGKEDLTATKLSALHDQVIRAETERMLTESLYDQVRKGNVGQLPEAFVNPTTAELQKRLSELTITTAQQSVKFGSKNPRVIEAQQQIGALQQEIDNSRKTLEDKLKAEFERTLRNEQTLQAAFNRAKAEAVEQNQTSIQYSILKQNVDTAKALYTDFLKKTNQADAQMAEQKRSVSIAEPAQIPTRPIGPNRLRVILTSFLLSLLGSIGLVFLIDYLNNKIKTVDDLYRFTKLPVLGVIPTVSQADGSATALVLSRLEKDQHPARSNYNISEAYRRLRTSILLAAAGRPPRTILFTSSVAGEGKTTSTVNIGLTLASLGARVLLIDADMRKPRIHKLFDISSKQGLSTFLSNNIEIDAVITETEQENLWVLPCGIIPPNSSDLVSSERMQQLLTTAVDRFDHVLIDSPPVLGASDPVILSRLVDGVILIVQGERSTRDHIRNAKEELRKVGAKIFGTVLNNSKMRRDTYYSSYYYYTTQPNAEEVEDKKV